MRVALATGTGDPDTRLIASALSARGARAHALRWDDPQADWDAYDLVVIRQGWSAARGPADFLAWAARLRHAANPPDTLRWNSDKRCIMELGARGLDVVPTRLVRPGDSWTPPVPRHHQHHWVIKPAARFLHDTTRYDLGDIDDRLKSIEHVRRLQRANQTVMVQPYAYGAEVEGEVGVIIIGGRFSHAVRKGAVAVGAPHVTSAQRELAEAALQAVPGANQVLFARVDLVPGPLGQPQVLDIELIAPALSLTLIAGAARRFASAIVSQRWCAA